MQPSLVSAAQDHTLLEKNQPKVEAKARLKSTISLCCYDCSVSQNNSNKNSTAFVKSTCKVIKY